jgi:hypothetical protein
MGNAGEKRVVLRGRGVVVFMGETAFVWDAPGLLGFALEGVSAFEPCMNTSCEHESEPSPRLEVSGDHHHHRVAETCRTSHHIACY